MNRIATLNRRYAASAALARNGVEVIAVGDAAGAQLNVLARELLAAFREDGPGVWDDLVGAVKALRWRLATQPQPIDHNAALRDGAANVAHQARRLHGAVANERLLTELEEAAARLVSSDPPLGAVLYSSILEVGERHCAVVAANTMARQALSGWLGALGVEVVTAGDIDRSDIYIDQAYVVGPPRFFRPSVVTAPATNSVSFLVPAWFGDRSLPRSAIAPYADGAIRIEARVFTVGDLQEVDATTIASEQEEELLPGPIWGERQSPHREPTFDEVEARMVLLSGNLAVWLDDGERIRTLDPAQPSGERVTYTPVSAVQQGTFLVLRQGESERGALHKAALKLLGGKRLEVESSQHTWKQQLSQRLSEQGYQAVSRDLRSRGVKAADRVRAWTEQCLVRPNKDTDFEHLLQWLKIPIQPTFGRAKLLRTALYRASAEIREQLEAAVSAQDMAALERDGHIRFDGQIEGFRGMIATRVLAIAPHKEIILRREARSLFTDRSGQWLE